MNIPQGLGGLKSPQEIMQLHVQPFAGISAPLQRSYNTSGAAAVVRSYGFAFG